MKSAFRKISRVGSLAGGTKWYLSEDCLLAAKRVLYTVEYRRFYLRDLECIMVWPSRFWLWRLLTPAVLLAALGASLWLWVDSTAGEVSCGFALAWVAWELVLGPTACSRIRTLGTTIEMPLMKRTRRAETVLAKIDAAIIAARGMSEQPSAPAGILSPAEIVDRTRSEASAAASIAAAPQTNGS